MIFALIVLLYSFQVLNSQQVPLFPPVAMTRKKVIDVGALFVDYNSIYSPYFGYTGSIGALYLAIDSIRDPRLLDGYTFNVTVRFDNCIERQAAGYAFELIRDFKADIIVGPTCNIPSISVEAVTAYYNLPLYTWGFTTANELADTIRFPTCVVLTANYLTLSLASLAVMEHFSWDAFAFIYTASEDFLVDVQKAVFQNVNFSISNVIEMRNNSVSEMTDALQQISTQARKIAVA